MLNVQVISKKLKPMTELNLFYSSLTNQEVGQCLDENKAYVVEWLPHYQKVLCSIQELTDSFFSGEYWIQVKHV